MEFLNWLQWHAQSSRGIILISILLASQWSIRCFNWRGKTFFNPILCGWKGIKFGDVGK